MAALKCVAGKAPRNMRRHTARILMIDECDAIEVSAEGDPIALAERRTMTFDDRKIIVGGTPIDEATSHVLRPATSKATGASIRCRVPSAAASPKFCGSTSNIRLTIPSRRRSGVRTAKR